MFLLVVLVIFAFQAFAQIDILTKGGPAGATETLVFKIFKQPGPSDHGIGAVHGRRPVRRHPRGHARPVPDPRSAGALWRLTCEGPRVALRRRCRARVRAHGRGIGSRRRRTLARGQYTALVPAVRSSCSAPLVPDAWSRRCRRRSPTSNEAGPLHPVAVDVAGPHLVDRRHLGRCCSAR